MRDRRTVYNSLLRPSLRLNSYKIAGMESDHAAGRPIQAFPPVRASRKETIPGSTGLVGKMAGAGSEGPGLGKLAQHPMDNVTDGLESNSEKDRKALANFVKYCG